MRSYKLSNIIEYMKQVTDTHSLSAQIHKLRCLETIMQA